ncbi:hypothetical protein Tco_0952219 [Tanacetum coccineum]|uniref:Retrovirus-related Pol polyprotein from transposon TNT 1-94-like beta-barrel domain-containing protein n=1 Tax=Tanacetum coccineum TaxID=301880 RepID=A0ABQ5DXB3_9ASTR
MSSNYNDIQAAGSDTRPPMLDRTDYESWSQRIRLYCRGKENEVYILQSIDQERTRTYDDLNDNEKKRFDADVRGTNIVLQGLPKDIYKLINHNIEAKAIWDNVKMLLAGSELTKEDRESQLYDEFERFKMLPGENIDEYYVRFHKLVNDMRNIRMTMPNIQLNSKFVNNMSPEWDRFVTTVKLNKGLKETNHEQLYEGQIVVQNVQGQHNQNQNQNQRYFARGNGAAGFGGHIARNYTQPKRLQNFDYFKDKMLLMQAQKNGVVLDEEEILFLVGEQPNTFDADVDNQTVRDLARNEDNIFQADECDAFDSNVDDEPTAQSIFMANLSSAWPINLQASSSDALILSEVPNLENANVASNNDQVKHEIHSEVQQSTVIDSNNVDIGAHNRFYLRRAKVAQPTLYDGNEIINPDHDPMNVLSSEEDLELAELARQKMHEKMNDPVCVEKRVKCIPPIYSKENFLATFTPQTQLTPEQVFWSIDLEKRKAKELKANTSPLLVLPPATMYPPNTPVHLVPRTLPTTSQVNIGLYVITQLFWDFEKTCKKRITPTGITEGERGFEQTKRCYLTEVIPFFNLLKEHFHSVQKSLVTEVRAMKVVFENMEAEVEQNAVDKKYGEIERKNLLITNENLIVECLFKDVFYTATDSVLNYQNLKEHFGKKKPVTSSDDPSFDSLFVIGKLNEQIQSRGNTIRELKEKISRLTKKNSDADPIFDLKALVSQNKDLTAKFNALHDLNERFRAENAKVKQHYKELYDSIKITRTKTTNQNNSLLSEVENLKAQLKDNSKYVTIPDSKPKVLAPGRYPIDVEPIPPRHKNNREVHLHYIKHLKESVETLREIVEDAKVERPLDTSLASACRYTKHSQELKKRVTFVKPCETSTHNTPAQVEHQKINSTNAPGIPSTGVKGASAASRSKPRSNTKKDRTLPAKSALKQVKAHSRMNKSNEKQKNRVDSSISYKHTVINSNSNTSCKTCNKCLISVNHDQCVVHSEMFVKQSPATKVWRVKQVKQVWKATGKLFTTIGHQWRPTGRLLPLGDQWPLTRNTPPKVLPTKQWKPTGRLLPLGRQCPLVRSTTLKSDCMPADPQETIAPVVQIVLWYLDSGCSKHMTGDRSRLRNFMKKFIGTVRFRNDHFGAIIGYGDYVIGDSVISRVYYVEGLGYNLFSVGQILKLPSESTHVSSET